MYLPCISESEFSTLVINIHVLVGENLVVPLKREIHGMFPIERVVKFTLFWFFTHLIVKIKF